jgi:hypothetical protein
MAIGFLFALFSMGHAPAFETFGLRRDYPAQGEFGCGCHTSIVLRWGTFKNL